MENKENGRIFGSFKDYLVVSRGLSEETARGYVRTINFILKNISLFNPRRNCGILRKD